jgi:hypothetical protein
MSASESSAAESPAVSALAELLSDADMHGGAGHMVFIESRGVLYRGPARALPKEVWDPQNLQWRPYIGAVPKPIEWGYGISQLQAWRTLAVDQGYRGFGEPP